MHDIGTDLFAFISHTAKAGGMQKMDAGATLMHRNVFDLDGKSAGGRRFASQLDDSAHIELCAGEGLKTSRERGEIIARAAMPGVGEHGIVKAGEIQLLLWSPGIARLKMKRQRRFLGSFSDRRGLIRK